MKENPDADIKIVEFGCFTCPYTKESEPAVKKLIETYNDSVYYVFKPFPLPNHENSYDVAIGVLCAAEQDKQWELREAVFRQQELCVEEGEIAIKQLAEDAGLNMAEFNECYDNKQTAEQLDRYIEQAKDSHIYATPTFFVNANVLVGPQPFEEFEKLIEEEKTS